MRLENLTNLQLYVVEGGSIQLEAVGKGSNPKRHIKVTGNYKGTTETSREVNQGILPTQLHRWRVSRAATQAANFVRETTLIAAGTKLPRRIPVIDRAFPQIYEARLQRAKSR